MLFGENFLVKYVNLFALNFTNKGVLRIMKAKKLVSLALPVMLLSGCITIETDSKKAEPKKEETQKMEKESKSTDSKKDDSLSAANGQDANSNSSSSKPSSSNNSNSSTSSSSSTAKLSGSEVEKYKSEIVENATKVDDVLKLIEKVASSDVKSYSQKKSEVQLSIGGAKAYVTKLRNLQAPPELKVEQENIKQSMELYNEAFALLFDAIEEQNESKINQSLTKAKDGSKLFEEATDSISRKTQ
ncbi:hypothetical protein JDS97_13355 [Bacillus cereus group sp. N18]|uniref:DUF7018 domain-containing (lipo)protein n=2 Tax=Bacillus cereus group TaxID=86661 RepID=UPI0008721C28|nr:MULTISPECIES: hypothetical protein [Bacillus cereus group]OFD02929.1 hypothetical protein BTGOE5_15870 [Bacillus thuringiensis]MBJ8047287.1 hypothetical protein [Bacillus cereus group sp. N18]MCU5180189.1 hypothetical protein [Bacillus toyonensis]OFD08882.1 hypothetical protein BTGOE7_16230 [Bacillus thuringiensis]PDZ83656.1 hypothetical protein CON93_20160 [Bacillus toyonensis]